jgi:hypothetical protein
MLRRISAAAYGSILARRGRDGHATAPACHDLEPSLGAVRCVLGIEAATILHSPFSFLPIGRIQVAERRESHRVHEQLSENPCGTHGAAWQPGLAYTRPTFRAEWIIRRSRRRETFASSAGRVSDGNFAYRKVEVLQGELDGCRWTDFILRSPCAR